MTTHATTHEKSHAAHPRKHRCADGWVKVGCEFLPMDYISRITVLNDGLGDEPPSVAMYDKSGTPGPHLMLEGEEAEALLCEIGYHESARKAEKAEQEKAAKAAHKKGGKGHSKGDKDADKEDAANGDGEAKGEAGEQAEQPKAEQPASGEAQPVASP